MGAQSSTSLQNEKCKWCNESKNITLRCAGCLFGYCEGCVKDKIQFQCDDCRIFWGTCNYKECPTMVNKKYSKVLSRCHKIEKKEVHDMISGKIQNATKLLCQRCIQWNYRSVSGCSHLISNKGKYVTCDSCGTEICLPCSEVCGFLQISCGDCNIKHQVCGKCMKNGLLLGERFLCISIEEPTPEKMNDEKNSQPPKAVKNLQPSVSKYNILCVPCSLLKCTSCSESISKGKNRQCYFCSNKFCVKCTSRIRIPNSDDWNFSCYTCAIKNTKEILCQCGQFKSDCTHYDYGLKCEICGTSDHVKRINPPTCSITHAEMNIGGNSQLCCEHNNSETLKILYSKHYCDNCDKYFCKLHIRRCENCGSSFCCNNDKACSKELIGNNCKDCFNDIKFTIEQRIEVKDLSRLIMEYSNFIFNEKLSISDSSNSDK